MSTTTAATASAATAGFVSLNPADGLFLRAEHLDAIQSYARALSGAIGVAAGTGVVYGFDLSIDDATGALDVTPGLAIAPTGRPLRATTTLRVSVKAADLPARLADGFWVVEVGANSADFGSENVYGSLCDEPCQGTSAVHPWTAESAIVTLRPDQLPGLDGVQPKYRRNWLASRYFERERVLGEPWLVPGSQPGIIASLRSRGWSRGAAQPTRATVPIGVLQAIDGVMVLDVWTARRDVEGRLAADLWRTRLAMRPWSTYIAQVLQFEQHLTSLLAEELPVAKTVFADPRIKLMEEFVVVLDDSPIKGWHKYHEFKTELNAGGETIVLQPQFGSLDDLGIAELPPAGILYGFGSDDGTEVLETRVRGLFGDGVDLEFCSVRADHVPGAITDAQHLDRIPLHGREGQHAVVEILVPVFAADLEPLYAEDYGWVAFARRSDADCDGDVVVESEPVDVYLFDTDDDETSRAIELLTQGELSDFEKIGSLDYPVGSWEYPKQESLSLEAMSEKTTITALVGVTKDDARRPLAALRASLFGASLDGGVSGPPVHAIVSANVTAELIVVIRSNDAD